MARKLLWSSGLGWMDYKVMKYFTSDDVLKYAKRIGVFIFITFTYSCSNSSSNNADPIAADLILSDAISEGRDESLLEQFGLLQAELVADTRDSLLRLNVAVSEGTLEPQFADCVAENHPGPVLEYYCGETGNFGTPSSLQSPVVEFSFVNDLACVSAMINDSDASACELSFVQIQSAEKYISYSYLEVDSIPVATIEISNSLVPNYIDVEFLTDYCKIRVIGKAEIASNNDDYCGSVVKNVMRDLQI